MLKISQAAQLPAQLEHGEVGALRARQGHKAHLLGTVAAAVALLAMTACGKTNRLTDLTGSTSPPSALSSEDDWQREATDAGQRYRTNPRDPDIAIRYAAALRATGRRPQAAAVLEQASIQNPKNLAVLGAYGRALADVGNYEQALDVLGRAHTPDQPDWHILSAQGAVLDELGRHEEARRHYASALKMAPDEPSVLSNLGLSYALSKDLKQAEAYLRQAVEKAGARADSRVRQNLALVVGLQGRFEEAESIARADLPSAEASANVAYLRQMLSQPNEWKALGRPVSAASLPNPS